jgi:2-phosphoglycerate kinase
LPALHYFIQVQEPANLPSDHFVAGLIGVGQALIPALQGIIEHHVAVANAGRIILEGDGILPALMEQLSLRGVRGEALPEARRVVKCLFLDEPDEQALLHNFQQRDRGFNSAASAEQRAYVHSVWQYGRWLAAEAQRVGLPLVPSRPFDTISQRVLAAINNSSTRRLVD